MWREVMWSVVMWRDSCEMSVFCSEVSYGEVLGDKSTMYIRVTLYRGYLIVLWLFHLVCILYCGCFNLFCNVWVCVCVCVCMCGFCNVCVCVCVCNVWVCMCGFCNVWVCVCVGFVMCGCFGNMCTCIYCVLYCLYCAFLLFRLCTFSFVFVCTSVRTTATEWQLNCS